MNAIGKHVWDEIPQHLHTIMYYILPLTIMIVLAMKAVGFSKFGKILSNKFAMHYGDTKDQIWIFYMDSL